MKYTLKYYFRFLMIAFLAGAWAVFPSDLHAAQPDDAQQQSMITQQLFSSPDDAVKALQTAVEANDKAALRAIFGPQIKDLLTGDNVQDAKNARMFAVRMAQGYMLDKEGDDKVTIEVGTNNWPMPIPLVKVNGQWFFDTAAGKEEIINRHIGKDELHAIGVCRAYVTGQWRYIKMYHGYYFKILTRQGNASPGAVLVAYPVRWDQSGIMTFIVDQDGKVYQQNFGERTSQIARALKVFDPDSNWMLVEDQGVFNAASKDKEFSSAQSSVPAALTHSSE